MPPGSTYDKGFADYADRGALSGAAVGAVLRRRFNGDEAHDNDSQYT